MSLIIILNNINEAKAILNYHPLVVYYLFLTIQNLSEIKMYYYMITTFKVLTLLSLRPFY